MGLDDRLAVIQADPHPLLFGRLEGAEKRLLDKFPGHPAAIVVDGNLRPVVPAACRNSNLSASPGIRNSSGDTVPVAYCRPILTQGIGGIHQKIFQDFVDLLPVDGEGRYGIQVWEMGALT